MSDTIPLLASWDANLLNYSRFLLPVLSPLASHPRLRPH